MALPTGHPRCLALAAALVLAARPLFATATDPAAAADPSTICEAAARDAALAEGVPFDVMMAITLAETGRSRGGGLRPWPWTVNMEGAGHWFDVPAEALAYVVQEYARGARSFDVGCFQINYRWHGQHFGSIEQMFDPAANATYAARYLLSLKAEFGTWDAAAGAYHSRTPEFAERYATRFARLRDGLEGGSAPDAAALPELTLAALDGIARVNRFPLLQSGAGAGLGSLVPIGNAAGVAMFGDAPSAPVIDRNAGE